MRATIGVAVLLTAWLILASAEAGSIRCLSCPREQRGRIERNTKAVREFKRLHPRPPGCQHCEVDHVVPLWRGGRDDPANMQWLPRGTHQEKTRREVR